MQWSPFASRAEWIASTNNNKAVIFNLNQKATSDHAPIQLTLDAHQGIITDINFSAHHPDVLATCALDTRILTWDLRSPAAVASHLRTPSNTFADWQGGATQVKWNRQNEYILASSHDRYVRIWDTRHGAEPITTIEAHLNKVYGIDWHRTDASKIITCSLDKTVKQWDGVGIVASIKKPTRTILTDYPLLRARHTPFPHGIVAMPQTGSASLSLYEQKTYAQSTTRPQHTFTNGECGGRLHEFLWRSRGNCDDGFDNRDFQLVTWATDHKLRLHSISSNTLKQAIGYHKGECVTERINYTRKGAQYITFANGPALSQEEQQSERSQNKARGGALTSLLKSSQPPKAGLAGLFQGQTRATMTARTVRRNPTQRVVSSVTWMHNVNIERRKTEGDGRTLALDDMEGFDLAAEVKAVGQKYPSISFEEFDPHSRKVVVAFKAPWGESETSPAEDKDAVRKNVFLRLTILFPDQYPGTDDTADDDDYVYPLNITIEKTTAAIAPLMIDYLRTGLEQIAFAYAHKGQSALGAVLTYALGDADLEEIIDPTSVLEEPIQDDLLQASSSEEEEDDDSESGELNKDLTLSQHSNTNIPLPAQTLVRWSHTGMLLTVRFPRPAWGVQNMNSSALVLGQSGPLRLPRHLKQNPSKDDIFESTLR